jgi:hypothetical protein
MSQLILLRIIKKHFEQKLQSKHSFYVRLFFLSKIVPFRK